MLKYNYRWIRLEFPNLSELAACSKEGKRRDGFVGGVNMCANTHWSHEWGHEHLRHPKQCSHKWGSACTCALTIHSCSPVGRGPQVGEHCIITCYFGIRMVICIWKVLAQSSILWTVIYSFTQGKQLCVFFLVIFKGSCTLNVYTSFYLFERKLQAPFLTNTFYENTISFY